jgi:hypothetical protein
MKYINLKTTTFIAVSILSSIQFASANNEYIYQVDNKNKAGDTIFVCAPIPLCFEQVIKSGIKQEETPKKKQKTKKPQPK